MSVTADDVRTIAMALPRAHERPSYGTPAWFVGPKGKLYARLVEDPDLLAVKVDLAERELLLAAQPETFVVTPHYAEYPMMLVRLSAIDRDELTEVITDAWRLSAPARDRAAFDGA
jgi:hypothetical protein